MFSGPSSDPVWVHRTRKGRPLHPSNIVLEMGFRVYKGGHGQSFAVIQARQTAQKEELWPTCTELRS
jgi:hypothetical protein